MNSPHHVEFTDNFVGGFYIAHLHTKTLYVPTKRSSLSHLSISLLINSFSFVSLSLCFTQGSGSSAELFWSSHFSYPSPLPQPHRPQTTFQFLIAQTSCLQPSKSTIIRCSENRDTPCPHQSFILANTCNSAVSYYYILIITFLPPF